MKIRLGLVLIALVIVLLSGFLWGYKSAPAAMQGSISIMPTPSTITTTEFPRSPVLQTNMRKLWEDHITWTRNYLLSAASDSFDTKEVAARLLINQEDIGNAIKPYYGEDAGNKLTSLLKEHITGAVELVNAAKAKDSGALKAANDKWYANAEEISNYLSTANPNLPKADLNAMMRSHLDLTKQEALDIINKKASESVTDYDKVHDEILKMADALTAAIVKQFPEKF